MQENADVNAKVQLFSLSSLLVPANAVSQVQDAMCKGRERRSDRFRCRPLGRRADRLREFGSAVMGFVSKEVVVVEGGGVSWRFGR